MAVLRTVKILLVHTFVVAILGTGLTLIDMAVMVSHFTSIKAYKQY